MQTQEQSAPQMMLAAISDMVAKGWHMLAILEAAYPGAAPGRPFHTDAGSSEPQNVALSQFVMPHGDHFHLYTFVMIRPELDTRNDSLTSQVTTALQLLDMTERSTVDADGHA